MESVGRGILWGLMFWDWIGVRLNVGVVGFGFWWGLMVFDLIDEKERGGEVGVLSFVFMLCVVMIGIIVGVGRLNGCFIGLIFLVMMLVNDRRMGDGGVVGLIFFV